MQSVDNYNTQALVDHFKRFGVTAEIDKAANWDTPGVNLTDPDGLRIQIGHDAPSLIESLAPTRSCAV